MSASPYVIDSARRAATSIAPPPKLRTYLCWTRQHTEFGEGWTAFETLATSYDDAVKRASIHVAGTRGAWTLQVEKEPLP